MSNVLHRDKKRRALVAQYEVSRRLLQALVRNRAQNLPASVLLAAQQRLQRLPRDSSPTRVRNRCVLTGRGKSVYRLFKLSRIMLRDLALQGKLPGVRKSSW